MRKNKILAVVQYSINSFLLGEINEQYSNYSKSGWKLFICSLKIRHITMIFQIEEHSLFTGFLIGVGILWERQKFTCMEKGKTVYRV